MNVTSRDSTCFPLILKSCYINSLRDSIIKLKTILLDISKISLDHIFCYILAVELKIKIRELVNNLNSVCFRCHSIIFWSNIFNTVNSYFSSIPSDVNRITWLPNQSNPIGVKWMIGIWLTESIKPQSNLHFFLDWVWLDSIDLNYLIDSINFDWIQSIFDWVWLVFDWVPLYSIKFN